MKKISRKIPRIMVTQHPDNAFPPFWRPDNSSTFIPAFDEVEECFVSFSELDCDEYMWDWEGKFVDEAVIDRLLYNYLNYFKKNPIGKNKFLTFRIPNTSQEKGTRLARAFMGIITAAHTANDFGLHSPPLFEVILPMTTHASQLIQVIKKFKQLTQYEEKIFERSCFGSTHFEMIPLIEGSVSLLESRSLLKKYVHAYTKIYNKKPEYLRPFIARSDPALDSGFVPAVLAAKGALSEYYSFSRESDIPVFPIIGAGGVLFRGGLSPQNLNMFLKTYPGIRTVTLQSSFRYDHPLKTVQKSISQIKRSLSQVEPVIYSQGQLQEMLDDAKIFAKYYQSTIENIAPDINQIASCIPKNRERIPHSGHFGYSRKLGDSKTKLPRAISFCAVLYSLGIPPTFIGTGRGIAHLIQKNRLSYLESMIPNLKEQLLCDWEYYNPDNLKYLAKSHPGWAQIERDIEVIQSYLQIKNFKYNLDAKLHQNATSNVLIYWKKKKWDRLKESIILSAQMRKALG